MKNLSVKEIKKIWKNEYWFKATTGYFTSVDEKEIEGLEKIHSSNSGSEYFISDDKKTLFRKSDHWGEYISTCFWYLDNEVVDSNDWKKGLKIGKIKFEDFEINFKDLKFGFRFEILGELF